MSDDRKIAGFSIREHPLARANWQLIGPDGQVWGQGPNETKERMTAFLSIASVLMQHALDFPRIGAEISEWLVSLSAPDKV